MKVYSDPYNDPSNIKSEDLRLSFGLSKTEMERLLPSSELLHTLDNSKSYYVIYEVITYLRDQRKWTQYLVEQVSSVLGIPFSQFPVNWLEIMQ